MFELEEGIRVSEDELEDRNREAVSKRFSGIFFKCSPVGAVNTTSSKDKSFFSLLKA